MMGDLTPQEKCCSGCGEYKDLKEHFDRDASKVDGYRTLCRECRKERLEGKKNRQAVQASRALDQQILRALANAKPGGSDIPHIAEVYQVLMRYFGGLEGFGAHYAGTYIASQPGSQTRERMLGNMLRMGAAVSDDKKVDLPPDLMSDQDLERELERRGGTSKIITGKVNDVYPDPPDEDDEPVDDDTDPLTDDDES